VCPLVNPVTVSWVVVCAPSDDAVPACVSPAIRMGTRPLELESLVKVLHNIDPRPSGGSPTGRGMMVVYAKRDRNVPSGAVYVGRPTKWGNPFVIGRDGSRAVVIAKFRKFLLGSPELMGDLAELRGKDLVCFCAPLECHADVLLELANGG